MSEDLHDIDKLFKDGIDGHTEEVPPSVWEAVSNDLDKKQTLLYKNKYNRLKRSLQFLLTLCFLGSAYMTYYMLNNKQTGVVQKNSVAKTIAAPSQKEKTAYPPTSTNKPGYLEKPVELNNRNDAVDDGVSGTFVPPSAKEQVEKHKKDRVKQTTGDEHFALPNSSPINNTQSNAYFFTQKAGLEKDKVITSNFHATQSLTAEPKNMLVNLQPLPGKDYSVTGTSPQALRVNPAFIMPQAKASAASNTKTAHGYSLTVFAAPNIRFNRLEDDEHLAGPGRNRHDAHRNEQENISFSGGLLLNYELNKNLMLQSGISVMSSSTSIEPKTVYAKADNNGHTQYELHRSSGYVYLSPKGNVQPAVGDSAKTSGTTSKLGYVSIPASLCYRIAMGRFSVSPAVGAGLNILTNGKTKTSLSNAAGSESTAASISGLKPVYVDGHIGVGIEYGLSQKLSISIRPNAKLALTPINKETPTKSYQNFLSVETGVRIKL